MSEQIRADMSCVQCGEVTPHDFVYVGRILASTTCSRCGHQVTHEHKDLVPTYIKDLEHRIATKPFRMLRRARWERGFLWSIPRAILRQPRKFLDDLRMLFRRNR